MSITRRRLLQGASLSCLASIISPWALAQNDSVTEKDTYSPENLAIFNVVNREMFEQCIGSSFQVSLNGKPLGSLLLLSVEELTPHAHELPEPRALERVGSVPRPATETEVTSFALQFQRPGAALPQNTYLLSQHWLGTFPLFLVPSGASGAKQMCTAVFSLLT
jgi:hypothetical protein